MGMTVDDVSALAADVAIPKAGDARAAIGAARRRLNGVALDGLLDRLTHLPDGTPSDTAKAALVLELWALVLATFARDIRALDNPPTSPAPLVTPDRSGPERGRLPCAEGNA